MIKTRIFAVLCFLLFSVVFIFNTESQDNFDIRTIDPTDMVSPSENERAMTAYSIGTYLMHQNRLDEAENFLKEAISLDPAFVDAMDHLGIVYRRQNRLAEAEEIYLRSIALNDRNRVPFINLAVVYRLQGRLNDAFQMYRHVVITHPDDPEGYFGIGTIYYIIDDYDNAMPFFDMAINLYLRLNSALVYNAFLYKGMIYFNTGNYDDAVVYLEEARKGNPNNETIEWALNEMKSSR